jgi:hypothetical protein
MGRDQYYHNTIQWLRNNPQGIPYPIKDDLGVIESVVHYAYAQAIPVSHYFPADISGLKLLDLIYIPRVICSCFKWYQEGLKDSGDPLAAQDHVEGMIVEKLNHSHSDQDDILGKDLTGAWGAAREKYRLAEIVLFTPPFEKTLSSLCNGKPPSKNQISAAFQKVKPPENTPAPEPLELVEDLVEPLDPKQEEPLRMGQLFLEYVESNPDLKQSINFYYSKPQFEKKSPLELEHFSIAVQAAFSCWKQHEESGDRKKFLSQWHCQYPMDISPTARVITEELKDDNGVLAYCHREICIKLMEDRDFTDALIRAKGKMPMAEGPHQIVYALECLLGKHGEVAQVDAPADKAKQSPAKKRKGKKRGPKTDTAEKIEKHRQQVIIHKLWEPVSDSPDITKEDFCEQWPERVKDFDPDSLEDCLYSGDTVKPIDPPMVDAARKYVKRTKK